MLLINSYGDISHERKKSIIGIHFIVSINIDNNSLQLVAINKCKLYLYFHLWNFSKRVLHKICKWNLIFIQNVVQIRILNNNKKMFGPETCNGYYAGACHFVNLVASGYKHKR